MVTFNNNNKLIQSTDQTPLSAFQEALDEDRDRFKLPFPVGTNARGICQFGDLASGHMLVSGSTGSGKSTYLVGLMQTLSNNVHPDEAKVVIGDTKSLDWININLNNLLVPVQKTGAEIRGMLKWCEQEMKRRLDMFSKVGATDIEQFNLFYKNSIPLYRLIIVIEEFQSFSANSEEMALITKLSQISRCIGFSLILSTQRPDCNIIKGQLKNNLAIRIAFRCTSFHDSKIATGGHVGAEKLLSRQLLAIIPGSKPEIYTAPLKESEPLSLKRRTEALCLNEPIVVLPKLSTFHKEKENNNNNFHLQNSNLTFKEVPSTIERLDGYVPPHKLFNKTANLKYRPTYILKNKWWKYVAIDLNTGRLLSNTRFSRAHLHALWNLSESYWRVINDVQSTGTCRNTKDITTAWKCVQLGLLKVADCDDNFLLSPDLQSPPSIFLTKHVASSIPVSKKIAKAIQNTRVAIARLWKQNRSTELVLGLPYLLSASGYVPAWKVKSKLVLAKESTDV